MISTTIRPLIRAAVTGVAFTAFLSAAPTADAQLSSGALTIKGTIWADGSPPQKVLCKASEGHLLDSSGFDVRVFHLHPAGQCLIYLETGGTGELRFSGAELQTAKKPGVFDGYVFSGTQTGSAPATGAAGGVLACPPDAHCKSEKGTITLYRHDIDNVVFIGKYSAKFEAPAP